MKIRTIHSVFVLMVMIHTYPVESLSANIQNDPVNVTSLLFEYVLICGFDFLCNKSAIDFPVRPSSDIYRDTYLCPDCRCDYACAGRGDCCPDVVLTLPKMECVTSEVFSAKSENSVSRYQMVKTCPENSSMNSIQECERPYTAVEKLQNLPVVSTAWAVTFKNRHCATCNGVTDFHAWNLNIDCEMFADFNYLSSYEEILNVALDNLCEIKFEPGKIPAKECLPPLTHFNTCPETFFYKNQKLTNDIIWACSYLDQSFGLFRNIFCYFCHVASKKNFNNHVISTCNTSRSWHPYDQDLENACLTFGPTSATYPYKNIFCYGCNRNWFDDSKYLDSVASVDEKLYSVPNVTVEYFLEIKHLKIPALSLEKIAESAKTLENKTTNSLIGVQVKTFQSKSIDNHQLNMTSLMMKYYSIKGYRGTRMCYNFTEMPKENLENSLTSCHCGTNCFFSTIPSFTPCCMDKAVLTPVTCLSDLHLSNRKEKETKYLVMGHNTNQDMYRNIALCRSDIKQENLLSSIPVNFFHDEIVYKHFSSYLCGGYMLEKFSIEALNWLLSNQLEPWDVRISCDDFLPFTHNQFLYDIIMLARGQDCLIKLIPKTERKECEDESDIPFKECNQTGNWKIIDKDVKWACENLENPSIPQLFPYRNVFCQICNPEDSNNTLISRCNMTGHWSTYDPEVERACNLFPVLNYHFPFKNIFCYMCNSPKNYDPSSSEQNGWISIPDFHYPTDDAQTKVVFSTFRNVFAISSYTDDNQNKEPNRTCPDGVFDWINNQCRQLSCYPGKRFVNGACRPLLTVTSNMMYSMSFGLYGNITSTLTRDTVSILHDISFEIQDKIKEALNVSEIDFNSFTLLSNLSCAWRDSTINGTSMTRIDIRTTFSVADLINRLESEKNLLDITENGPDVTVISNDANFSFHIIQDAVLRDMYQTKLASDFRKNCYIEQNSGHIFVPFQNYRTSFISKLLLCRHVLLDPREYSLDEDKMELTVMKTGFVYSAGEFEVIVGGEARLCIENYSNKGYYKQRKLSPNETALGILTLVCTVISLVCLCLTFLTYCFLRKLRSLPGKNNMCLVVSLFCAQGLLQFGLRQTNDIKLCQVIGVFLHFFWLSTFGCMNICCYHMFCVLGGSLSHQLGRKSDNRVLLRYFCYTVGVPILIIAITISIFAGTSGGESVGYGGKMCFLNNVISAVLTFLLPLFFVCISNTVFFSITLYKIRNAPKVQSNKENRDEVILYLKLFTLTGITWVLMIIDAFLPLSPFSFFVTVLNGFQGVFIFISYICNRRVVYLYLGLIKGEHPPYTTSFSSTFAKQNTTTTSTTSGGISHNKTCSETIA